MPAYRQSCELCSSSDILVGKDEADVNKQHTSSKKHLANTELWDKVVSRGNSKEMNHGKDHN